MKAGASVGSFIALLLSGLCSAADIAIDHIEFVQVAQDRDNHVPLVAGKSTVARVFLTSSGNNGQDVTSGISGTLNADGFSETLKPFGDPPAIAPPASPDQNNQRHSLNFLLPPAWTNPPGGSLQVRAAVTLSGGPPRNQTASAAFQTPPWPPVFRVLRLEVCAPDGDNNRQCPSNFGDVSEFMQKIYPLPDGRLEYNPVAAGSIEWPEKLGFRADDADDVKRAALLQQILLTRFLLSYYFLMEQSAPDQLFAWIPAAGGVAGLEDFATAKTGGLGHVWWSAGNCAASPCSDVETQALGRNIAAGIAYNLGLRAGAGAVAGGFDPRAGKIVPALTPDLMSLFGAWPSAATFQALFNTNVVAPTSGSASAEYLIIGGAVTPDGSVAQLDPGYRVLSSTPAAPSDPAGTHCLRFSGGAAADYCFSPFFLDPNNPTGIGGFQVKAPLPPGTARVALIRRDPAAGDSELAALSASGDAPTLSIIAPSAGDAWQGTRSIQWTGSDPGGASLVYTVQYSADNGASWTPLAIDWKETQLEVDGTRIWGGSQVLFRVLASNGLNTTTAVVGPVTVIQSPKLVLDQTALNFQGVPVGQGADRALLLTNPGSGPLTVSGQITSGPFGLLSAAGNLVIPAGGQRAITVRWIPAAAGPRQGTLALTSSDPSLAAVNVALSGLAVDGQAPTIVVSPSSLDFGSVTSGQTKDLKFTISNNGAAPLTVSSITSSNARFSIVSTLPATVAAGQTAEVTVRFSPNVTGAVSGTLTIASNDPAGPAATIAVTGTGAAVPQAPSISVTPASLDFGSATVGLTKDSKFTISNTGTSDLSVRSITSSSAAFTILSPAAPFTVVAGRPVVVSVRFAPSTAGAAAASLTIASNDPARPGVTVAVTGNGVATIPANVLRTIGYHEITSLTSPLDVYNVPAISRSGNRAAFTIKTDDVWVVNTDGTGLRQIDSFPFPNPHFLGISDDGSKVLVWNPQFLRIANADGSPARTLLVDNTGLSILGARLTGDGKTVVFVSRDGNFSVGGGNKLAGRGVWTIGSDGNGLRQLAGTIEISGALGSGGDIQMVADSGYPGELDVSVNGSRIVFGVASNTRGRVLLGINGDGSAIHVIRAGLFRLLAIAISGDGATVAYSSVPQTAPEVGVVRFDGTGGLTLASRFGPNILQVSNDGSLVFAGGSGSGYLLRADGSSIVQLFAPLSGSPPQLVYENGDLNRASMNGDGTKFLFTTPDAKYPQNGIISLATAELNPASLGAAPAISGPAIDPISVPADGKGYSVIITAKVSAVTPVTGASAQAFLQGLPESAGTGLTDTGGGAWAGSIFQSSTAAGPRVIRIKVETQAPDGKRHATALDLGGFTVGPR